MKPTIPSGWRRLATGDKVKRGDKMLIAKCWIQMDSDHDWPIQPDETIIRRVAGKGKRK